MKKAIATHFYGEGNPNNSVSEMGFIEEIKWRASTYYGVPSASGLYLVSDGKGNIDKLLYDAGEEPFSLFAEAINGRHDSVVFEDDTAVTDSDLVTLARRNQGWYKIVTWHEYEDEHSCLVIYKNRPKYYLSIPLEDCDGTPMQKGCFGPIDDQECETVEIEDWENW